MAPSPATRTNLLPPSCSIPLAMVQYGLLRVPSGGPFIVHVSPLTNTTSPSSRQRPASHTPANPAHSALAAQGRHIPSAPHTRALMSLQSSPSLAGVHWTQRLPAPS